MQGVRSKEWVKIYRKLEHFDIGDLLCFLIIFVGYFKHTLR